jgi:hypothetical protein
MAKNFTPEQINDAFGKMPPVFFSAMLSVKPQEKIRGIGQNYNLHLDVLGEIEGLVTMHLIGLVTPDEFVEQLRETTGLPSDQVNKMLGEVNENIFLKIRERMREESEVLTLREEISETELEPKTATPAPKAEAIESIPLEAKETKVLEQTGFELGGVESHFELDKQPQTKAVSAAVPTPVEEKMTQTVRTPIEKSEVGPTTTPLETPAVVRKIDPYREIPI